MDSIENLTPKAALNKAITLVNMGQLQQAIDLCREILEQQPDEVNMTALMGAMLLKSRQASEAEEWLRRAIELAPSFAKPHEDLGFLLVEAGRADEAVTILETATRLDPKSENAYYSLGKALAMLGRGADADRAFEAAFDLNPIRKNLAYAAEHHQAGRFDEAERCYREVLRGSPNNVDAMRLLAGILIGKPSLEEAEDLLRQVVALAPDYSLAWLDLGGMMHEQHRYREAIECFEQAIRLEPNRAKPIYMMGGSLAPAGRTDDALKCYQRVVDIQPTHAGGWLSLGHTLKTVGRQTEAVDAYRECIRVRPDNGEAFWSLANLKTYQLSAEDIAAMRDSVEKDEGVSTQSRVNLLFALGKASEDAGDYDAAWDFYSRGNSEQRQLEYYDSTETEVSNDELIEVFDAELLERLSGLGDPDPSPIFILGLPRSGSTLLEQILSSHSAVEGTSELPYIGRVATSLNRNRADGINYPFAVRELGERHLRALANDYLTWAGFHRHTDRPFFVDKMPNNFPSIGLIHLMLPNAKIIDARRYPLDSTFSCYRQLFAKGQTFVYDLSDIGEYYLQYQRIMDYWHQVLPGRVLTVQYEDMVTDFDDQVRRLLDYCELPFEEDCLNFYKTDRPVRTASSEQVRQPVYTKSVHYWRNYEQHLEELIEVLEPVLPRYAQYESINRD
ncbi:MAG: sulfotransferase [Pseudomonadota bacterium]